MANCKKTLWLWVLILFSTPLAAQLSKPEEELKNVEFSSYFFSLDAEGIKRDLSKAGNFRSLNAEAWRPISLPDSKGIENNFLIAEAPAAILEVYNTYPQNKTYRLKSTERPESYGVMSVSDKGFEATIFSKKGVISIEPVFGNIHRAYTRSAEEMKNFICGSIDESTIEESRTSPIASKRANGDLIRTYRMAVAAGQ